MKMGAGASLSKSRAGSDDQTNTWGFLVAAISVEDVHALRLTSSTTNSNHTNLAGLETAVQALILPVRIGVHLDISGVVEVTVLLESIFSLAIVRRTARGADLPVAAGGRRHDGRFGVPKMGSLNMEARKCRLLPSCSVCKDRRCENAARGEAAEGERLKYQTKKRDTLQAASVERYKVIQCYSKWLGHSDLRGCAGFPAFGGGPHTN